MKREETYPSHVLSEDLDLRGPHCLHRAVRLTGRYVGGVEELIARIRPGMVTFEFLRSGKKARHFGLGAAEADAFVEAWLAFKRDLAVAQEAERHRLSTVLEEALRIAEELGGTITPSYKDVVSDDDVEIVYDLSMPAPYSRWDSSYAPPDIVFAHVKRAKVAQQNDATLSDARCAAPRREETDE